MKRLDFFILMIIITLLTWGFPKNVYAEGEMQTEAPHLVIPNYQRMPVFQAGEKAVFYVPIKNTSSGSAKNLVVSLVVGDLEKFPFRSDKMSFSYSLDTLVDSSLFGFDVMVPSTMKAGIYPINVNATYTGGSLSATVYVKIENNFKQPALVLQNTTVEGEKLHKGKTSKVNLLIKNDGDLPLKNIEVHLAGFSPNNLNLDNWPDTQYIRGLKPQETISVEFQINADSEIKTGTYALDLNLKYQDEDNNNYTKDGKVYLPVLGKGSQDDITPRVLIENYTYGGGYAQAGQTFALTLSLVNTSLTETVRNIKISLNSDGQVFSPVGNSNSIYIASMEPGSRLDQSIGLKPKEKAENQTYVINAEIDFQDEQGNKFTEKELISIPVYQQTKLVTSEVEIPQDVFAGNPVAISMDYHNGGKALISNLLIRTSGDFETQDASIYVGNLEAGKGDYYDVTIIPRKPGPLTGTVILEYDDDLGQHYTQEKAFHLTVGEAPSPPPIGPEIVPDQETKLGFKIWMLPIILVILAVPVMLLIRKRRKAAAEDVDFDD